MTVPVSEIYGPVFQGEGPYVGRRVWFLRLGLCNLSCSWCDTPFTWDRSRFDVDAECPPMTFEQLRDRDWGYRPFGDPPPIVLTGGEPVMHRNNETLREFVELFAMMHAFHVETNGTLMPSTWLNDTVTWWSVSPKLKNSGVQASKRIKPTVLSHFADLAQQGRAGFKFVAESKDDLPAITAYVDEFDIPGGSVWVMPEGVTAIAQVQRMRELEAAVLDCGWNLTPRLHVLLHDNERGV